MVRTVKVALVSDIHGNAVAFDAVLDDISDHEVDAIVCLGDVATLGPEPSAVLDRLRRLGCLCVRGNHDDYLLQPDLVDDHSESPDIREAINWARDQLTGPDLDQVAGFVDRANVELDGTVLTVFHGCPDSNTVDLLATTPPEDLDLLLSETGALLAGGHTHLQMVRQHRGKLLVNPGSVGLPFVERVAGRPPTLMAGIAEYAIVEVDAGRVGVSLRRVPVSLAAVSAAVHGSQNPFGPALLAAWAGP